ncbi:MAG TPA: hypothetical protein VI893_10430 [Thermoplasmata archaeon]|nr:hypothetical protein [Thermoplasmata archaeon]
MAAAEVRVTAWSKRNSLIFHGLAGMAVVASIALYLEIVGGLEFASGPLVGGLGAVVLFLWVLALREFLGAYGSYSQTYKSVTGSQLGENAKEALVRLGFELVEDEKSQSIGATIYRLRWSRKAAWVKAEIWAHGNRANVKVKFSVEKSSEWGYILGAFEPVPSVAK